MKKVTSVLGLSILWPLASSWAQVRVPNEAGVSLGHWHAIVQNMEVTKKFWMILGGAPIVIDGIEVMKFPGAFVFLTLGSPSGGSEGTTVDHIGFGVPKRDEFMEKLKAAGVKFDPAARNVVYSPDDLKVEITEESGIAPYPRLPPDVPIESNHIHFYMPLVVRAQMRDWYAKMFAGIPSEDRGQLLVDIPGAKFIRWTPNAPPTATNFMPTKGRALDHIGFEVKNLQAFCKDLKAKGVRFDQAYNKSRHKSFASAKLTDPWGTSIELTEGLNRF